MATAIPTVEYARLEPAQYSWRAETAHLMRQALPNIGTTVMRMMMVFIDFVMVSRLGTDALAAISPATLFIFITVAFGMAIANTVTTFSAQAFGRREMRETSAYAWQAIYLAGFFGLLSWPLAVWLPRWLDPLFTSFGHSASVRAMEITYCTIGVWSIAPTIAAAGLEGFFNAVRRPVIGMRTIAVALVVHVVLNYALIFGHFGLPAMGIAGSAISLVVAWGVRAVILMCVFLSRPYAQTYATRETFAASALRLRRLIGTGAPTSVQWVLDIGAWWLFLAAVMGRFGTESMAAADVALQYMHLSFMPAIGVGIALCALVGHAIGEGRPELAVRRTRIAGVIVTAYMGVAGLVFLFGRRWLMGLMNSEAAVIEAGAAMLIWTAAFQICDGMAIVYNNALRGAGDTRWPTVAFVVASWGIFLGGGWLTVRYAPWSGIHGPWAACTLYIVVLGIALWWRFLRGPWREIRLFDAGHSQSAVSDQRASADDREPALAPHAAPETVKA